MTSPDAGVPGEQRNDEQARRIVALNAASRAVQLLPEQRDPDAVARRTISVAAIFENYLTEGWTVPPPRPPLAACGRGICAREDGHAGRCDY